MYYRTSRLIAIRGEAYSEVEVRTYTEAASEAEARLKSRQQALNVVHAGKDTEVVGLESVVSVPGVTAPRHPEILVAGKWQQAST